ncbi:Uncharacterized protein PECH_000249 [Penicillium ucsense]|uniref:Uncharacterized protein n=1 Tax=Penicillium ucsense TaxID=2839758 RepID=A0A8J8W921_9EURO|nr:Uncharacterized protein PECM_008576 [Penicillium ucsense]KAF7738529.1 Uncharacterized protein PECH_000249 [Penicillium ucsense]
MASVYELEPWCITDFQGQDIEKLHEPMMVDHELYPGFMTTSQDYTSAFVENPQEWIDPSMAWTAQPEYPKTSEPQRYPQSWVDAGLTIHSPGGKWNDLEDPSGGSNSLWNHRVYNGSSAPDVERQRWNSLMATQRALFMTPTPPTTKLFTGVPGSPLSDPCGTPDTSNASMGSWEADRDGEDMHQSRSLDLSSTHGALPELSYLSAQPAPSQWEEEDCSATLEMPDGTTRRTLNWLPVDTSAGLTIGAGQADHAQREQDMHDFRDLQGAFIPNSAQSWTYNR